AALQETNMAAVLMSKLSGMISEKNNDAIGPVSRLFPYQNPEGLKPFRTGIESFSHGPNDELRQNAWAALVLMDDGFESAWTKTAKSQAAQSDLLNAIPRLTNPDLRSKAFGGVKAMIENPATPKPVMEGCIRAIVSMSDHQEEAFGELTALIAKKSNIPA